MTVLILASSSTIRAQMLSRAGVTFDVQPARIDEQAMIDALGSEGAGPRDIADALAESKALRIANRNPEAMVLGCDQLLEIEGRCLNQPASPAEAGDHLRALRGRTQRLSTAVVLYKQGEPRGRHVSVPKLTMRDVSDGFIETYVAEHWDSIRHCVGCYQIEGFGIRLFQAIEGDLFAVQGLPLLELLTTLARRGDIPA